MAANFAGPAFARWMSSAQPLLGPQVAFSIRNGPINTATPVYMRRTVPRAYRHCTVGNLTGDQALGAVFAHITGAQAVAAAAGGLRDEAGAALPADVARWVVIALGSVRAGLAAFADIMAADIMPSERAEEMFEYVPGPGGAAGAWGPSAYALAPIPDMPAAPGHAEAAPYVQNLTAYRAAVQALEAGAAGPAVPPPAPQRPVVPQTLVGLDDQTIEMLAQLPGNCPAAHMLAMKPLTEAESGTVRLFLRISQGILPYQGYNLLMLDHHHLSSNLQLMMGILGELFGKVGGRVNLPTPFTIPAVIDAIFHKAGHPVEIRLKQAMALDPNVPEMLRAGKMRALAVRLPYRANVIRIAATYAKVVNEVNTIITPKGGSIDVEPMGQVLAYAEAMEAFNAVTQNPRPAAVGAAAAPPVAPPLPDVTAKLGFAMTPANYLGALEAVVEKVGPLVAFAYGYYTQTTQGLAITGGTRAGGGQITNTLAEAYSLEKLRGQSMGNFAAGVECARQMAIQATRAARRGEVAPPVLTLVMPGATA